MTPTGTDFAPIAIVGRSCLLPGANTPGELWDAVLAGRDLTSTVPADRWGLSPEQVLCDGPADSVDRTWSDRGGYVDGFDDLFDPTGFGLAAAEIDGLDPVFKWALHTARQALVDAGHQDGDSHRQGAVFGNLSFPSAGMAAYTEAITLAALPELSPEMLATAELPPTDPRNRFTSGLPALVLERALGLGVGALALDAACASSLYAIKLACDALHDGRADLMLAGAVNCADDLCIHIGFSALTALSRTGRSRPFHAEADGLVPAEGCAFVVLRRLDDAVRDGDTVHGVIRGVGLSNDGRGRGMLVPSSDGQARAMRQALEVSGLAPTDISLLECHATGTSVGDATEIRSSAEVYRTCEGLPIGSLKSNTGHLITAAGVAGLLKVIEAMAHETRPPTIGVDLPLPDIDTSPLRLLTEAEPWERDTADGILRAGVSAFGFGGNNAHLIVEEPPQPTPAKTSAPGASSTSSTESRPVVRPRSADLDCSVAIVGIGVCAGSATGLAEFSEAILTNTPGLDANGEGRMADIMLDIASVKFPPNDLQRALAQQLAMLAVTEEAVDGCKALPAASTGVYVGMGTDPEASRFGVRWRLAARQEAWGLSDDWLGHARDGVGPPLDAPAVLGTMPNIVANRLNSQFDFTGASFTVSSEERSGIDALRLAARALRVDEIDAAIVGAADLSCEPVHRAASGDCLGPQRQTPGDGAVALVLKRLDDATADGDTVYAVLPGTDPVDVADPTATIDLLLGLSDRANALTQLFGHAHAASGLLHVAAGAVCLHHRSTPGGAPLLPNNPGNGSGLPAVAGPRTVGIEVAAMEGVRRELVVLAEANDHPAPTHDLTVAPGLPRLHVFSGADSAGVLAQLEDGCESTDGAARLVIVADGPGQLAERGARAVRHIESGYPAGPGVHFRQAPLGGDMGFVFTAAGSAYAGMGAQLLRAIPELVDGVGTNFALGETAGWLYGGGGHRPSPDDFLWGTSLLSSAHSELTLGLLGLKPSAAIGYSSGESNSLFAFGVWNDRAAMRAEIAESAMMSRELGVHFDAVARAWGEPTARWAMWNVLAPIEAIREAIAGEPRVHLAIINTGNDGVIGGDASACARVVDTLGRRRCWPVEYNLACHVPEVGDGFHQAWVDVHTRAVTPPAGVRFYSNGTTGAYEVSTEACAEAITYQAEHTLDFPATIEAAYADGVRVFVEHGPGGACTNYISEILGGRDFLAVALDRRDHNIAQVYEVIGALVAAGVQVGHSALGERLAPSISPEVEPPPTQRGFASHPPAVVIGPLPAPERRVETGSQITSPQSFPPSAQPELYPLVDQNGSAQPQQMIPAPTLPSVLTLQPPAEPTLSPAAESDPQHSEPAAAVAPEEHGWSPVAAPSSNSDHLVAHIQENLANAAAMHQRFVRDRQGLHERFVAARAAAVASLWSTTEVQPEAPATALAPATAPAPETASAPATPTTPATVETGEPPSEPEVTPRTPVGPAWDKEELEIHSSGRISELFGNAFAAQDSREIQCRMPEPPLLLADRVTGIEAEPGVLGTGTIWTETDVTADAWYLNAGYMPTGFMIESGQADLMLISYMGIDLINEVDRAYRLLGCTLTYHGDLPAPGETLAYEIRITGHARHGDVRLFFFEYDCLVDGERRLTVRNGQAGFFNPTELAEALGVLWTPEEGAADLCSDARVDPPAIASEKRSFDKAEVVAFSEGRVVDCFGPAFAWAETHTRTPSIQSGDQLFIDEVTHLDPSGGPWGRGTMTCETAIAADAWFFDGHFKNDPCMPGNFMVEACIEALSFYLAALGFTVNRDGWRFQPLPGQPFELKCRGEINPQTRHVAYEVHVEEVWSDPHPTVICDVIGFVDGKAAFHAHRIAVELTPSWPLTSMPELLAQTSDRPTPMVATDAHGFPFDWSAMISCAWGRPSEAFGSMYEVFDGTRRSPRLPGPPYHFISRIRSIDGELDRCQAGMEIVCEYDIPSDAWYFDENGAETMPFAVLLEAALQPCGWVASAVGSATAADDDMLFRNLDGTGTITGELTRTSGTLTTKVKLTNVSRAGGMVIESFEVECFLGDRSVYVMDTVFGFFPPEAFDAQVGLAIAEEHQQPLTLASPSMVDLTEQPARYCAGSPRLAQPMLLMLDRATHIPSAGRAGLGVVRGEKDVDITEWFFKAHFFQDPVQPGSLGIEALLQLLQFFMIDTDMGSAIEGATFEPLMIDAPLTWKYRGQVTPKNSLITSVMEITEVGHDHLGPYVIGTGSLWCDGLRIYEVQNMGMRIASNGHGSGSPGSPGSPVSSGGAVVDRDGEGVAEAAPFELDKGSIRREVSSYWHRQRETPERWLGDDLIDGLIDRYVRRMVTERVSLREELRGRSAIYLANHQVQIESLLITNLLPALTGVSMTTVANAKHERRWIGEMIRSLEAYPDSRTIEQIAYFDQTQPGSMYELIDRYRSRLARGSHSLFVHSDGTRSQSCRQPVQRCSSVFIDLALELGLPIVPVRFTGGLPITPIAGKAEFPVGHGQQDYWIGQPIEAADLHRLGLRQRIDTVVDAINALGGSNQTEVPLPGDDGFESRVQQWQDRTGVHEVYAAGWQVLGDYETPSEETETLRRWADGDRANDPLGSGEAGRPWLLGAAEMFLGSTSDGDDIEPGPTPAISVSRTSHPHLVDHCVDSHPVTPAAYAIEWFARELPLRTSAQPGFPVTLKNFRVLKGVVLDRFAEGAVTELGVTSASIADHDGAAGLRLHLVDQDLGRPRYGCVVDEEPGDSPAPGSGSFVGSGPLATLEESNAAPEREIYRPNGVLFHGPAFRVLSDVSMNAGVGAQAVVAGLVRMGWPSERWATDPALIDGLLQMALLWHEKELVAASLPTAIESVRTFAAPGNGVYRAQLVGVETAGTRVRCDIRATDEDGMLVAELAGVETHSLPAPKQR